MAKTSKSEAARALSPISTKDYSSKQKAVKHWDDWNVPFASSNLMIISKQEVWDYHWEALVLMSRLLLFLFMRWFALSDSHGTASNYIFAVAICGLMVFLIDLSQAYHSVVAATILEWQNMAAPHPIFHFFKSKCCCFTLKCCRRFGMFELYIFIGNRSYESDRVAVCACAAVMRSLTRRGTHNA